MMKTWVNNSKIQNDKTHLTNKYKNICPNLKHFKPATFKFLQWALFRNKWFIHLV